jgi:hypothetical protein
LHALPFLLELPHPFDQFRWWIIQVETSDEFSRAVASCQVGLMVIELAAGLSTSPC